MTGHGSYGRKPKDLARAYQIRVKRWQCQQCRQTTSCLPSCLLSWRHYLVAVIQTVLVQRLEQGGSWSAIVRQCSHEELPALRTMQRWVAAFNERAAVWLPDVSQTIAEQDSYSPWLEPRPPTSVGGPSVGPSVAPSMGTLLLTAILYLLAWAKTRWPELAGYGLADRLAFLWHWGHDRGLGRLV